MIYPDAPLLKWMQKYKLTTLDCKCNDPKPFITNKIVGIECKVCRSGSWIKKDINESLKLYRLWHG